MKQIRNYTEIVDKARKIWEQNELHRINELLEDYDKIREVKGNVKKIVQQILDLLNEEKEYENIFYKWNR